ncbi:MAG: RnfABCDGE type electron transport complex subunit G [Bacillota bacterium]
MAQEDSSLSRLVITLTVIGIVSALLLSVVYQWTTPHIEEHEAQAREEAIFSVLEGADEYEEVTKDDITFFEGYDESGDLVGVSFIAEGSGYQGTIEIMVGADPSNGEITYISVLNHEETPGLGARITEEEFKDNFANKPFGEYELVNREPTEPHEVETIAGATISTRSVKNIVSEAGLTIEEYYGGGN